MSSVTFMKFYPSDWRADPALRMCSLAARGLWMEILCLMNDAEPRGTLRVNGKALSGPQLAMLVGDGQIASLLDELDQAGVFSRDDDGTIYSRRMVRETEKAKTDREFGNQGGNPKLTHRYNVPGFIYLMGQRADGAYKIGISNNPANRLKKIRAQYTGVDIRVISMWPVADMEASEAKAHKAFEAKKVGEWFALDGSDIETLDRLLKGSAANVPKSGSLRGTHKAQIPDTRSQIPESSSGSDEPSQAPDAVVSSNGANELQKEFEEVFWPIYPNKVGKEDARRAWPKARKQAELETIVTGLRNYVAKLDDRKWLNPATWLNGIRWTDEPAEPPKPPPGARPAAGMKRTFVDAMMDREVRNGSTSKSGHSPAGQRVPADGQQPRHDGRHLADDTQCFPRTIDH